MSHRSGSDIRLIICDFGGVICSFDYDLFCARMAQRTGRTLPEIRDAAFAVGLQREFESGMLSGREYHRAVMAGLGQDIPYEEFCRMYGDIFTPIPGTGELLRRLRERYTLYLLSDTNEIHFDYVWKTQPALQLFAEFILSYRIGAMKPDPAIYREALRRSGLPAEACVFVDDRPANVEGAERAGIRAVVFESAQQMARKLCRAGVELPA